MSVYVDDMAPCLRNRCWRYNQACHLVANTVAELHQFAAKGLGLKRSWFQNKTVPHYDLTVNKRKLAVKLGAIEIDKKSLAQKIREQRQGCTGCEKGLVYVAKKIVNGTEAECKKLHLCDKCRATLIKTVKESF